MPLSVLIRWFLNSDCSHFTVVFKAEDGGLMFESNLLGTHPKFYKTALKHMTVVHEIELNIGVDSENYIWDLIVDKVDGSPYNYAGFFYFCSRAILLKLFKIPLPHYNLFRKNGAYLCTQIFNELQVLSEEKIAIDTAMISPQGLFEYAKDWVKRANL